MLRTLDRKIFVCDGGRSKIWNKINFNNAGNLRIIWLIRRVIFKH